MPTSVPDYRKILRGALEEKSRAAPGYSLRSFARDVGLSPSRLSEIFHGKQGLSAEAASQVGRRLGMNDADLAYFRDLVEAEHARSSEKRRLARLRLERNALGSEFHVLGTDAFRAVSDWYHFAILQLFELRSFRADPEWISSALGITAEEADGALERLLRLEMLDRAPNGKLSLAKDFVATSDGIPSSAIRKFHRQVLEKALVSVESQTVERRALSANFIALDRKRLDKAKAALKRFRLRFVKEFGKTDSAKDAVYCLSMQLFELTQGPTHAKK